MMDDEKGAKMPLMEDIQPGVHFATTRRYILQPRGGTFCNHEEVHFATTRRYVLQPRGGMFCNHEEKNFATTRRKKSALFSVGVFCLHKAPVFGRGW